MTDSKQELEGCPLCGGEIRLFTSDGWCVFNCAHCCLSLGYGKWDWEQEAEAIAAWNARPADLTGDLVEALRYLSVTADHHRAAAAIAYNAVMGHSRSANDAIDEEIESRSVLEAAQRVAQAVLAKVDAAKEGK